MPDLSSALPARQLPCAPHSMQRCSFASIDAGTGDTRLSIWLVKVDEVKTQLSLVATSTQEFLIVTFRHQNMEITVEWN